MGDGFGVVDVSHVTGPQRGDGNFMASLEAECAVEGQGAPEVAEVGEEWSEEVF